MSITDEVKELSVAELLNMFEGSTLNGFVIGNVFEESKQKLGNVFGEKYDGLRVIVNLEANKMALKVRLENLIISAILARVELLQSAKSGTYFVCDPVEARNKYNDGSVNPDSIVSSLDARIKDKGGFWHDGGVVWADNDQLKIGFY